MIKRYAQFISEKMGVPEGNTEAAKELFEAIAESLGEDISLFAKKGHSLKNRVDLGMKIGELLIESVEYEIQAKPHDLETKIPTLLGMAVNIPPSDADHENIFFDKDTLGEVKLKMMFSARPDATMRDAKSLMESDSPRYVGILSHELKHVYDKFMLGKEMVGEVADYQAWSNVSTGLGPIDEIVYYMYVMSKTESLVRPSEIAGEIIESRLKKSEFLEFLKSNNLYQTLKKINSYTIEELKSTLMSHMDKIRKAFKGIPKDHTDEDVANRILDIGYHEIVGHTISVAEDILGLEDKLAILLGKVDPKYLDSMRKLVSKRSFSNGEEYFGKAIEEMSYRSGQVMKKISKLYDFCEDDSENQLMSRISAR